MQTVSFGKNRNGEETSLYIFENSNHGVMKVSDHGATLVSLLVRTGKARCGMWCLDTIRRRNMRAIPVISARRWEETETVLTAPRL